jgi:hypothetical protein
MAAPDIPHPAIAPSPPHSSADVHHDEDFVLEDSDDDEAAVLRAKEFTRAGAERR